jgi:nucleotide-binding universal stress UspA family protein
MKTLLVPTDFSEYATKAMYAAVQIAAKTGATIVIQHNVTCLLNWGNMTESERRNYPETLGKTVEAELKMEKAIKNNLFKNVTVNSVITHGITSEEIISLAARIKAGMIIMGSHGNEGPGRYFIGSNIQKVMREAKCPVLTVKKDFIGKRWKKVVFAFNIDEDMNKPFKQIADLAKVLGSTVHLLFVNTPGNFKDTPEVTRQLDTLAAKYPELKFERAIYNQFNLDSGIQQYAQEISADWIAMAAHNRRNKPGYLLGITESVAFHTNIPVLSVNMNL